VFAIAILDPKTVRISFTKNQQMVVLPVPVELPIRLSPKHVLLLLEMARHLLMDVHFMALNVMLILTVLIHTPAHVTDVSLKEITKNTAIGPSLSPVLTRVTQVLFVIIQLDAQLPLNQSLLLVLWSLPAIPQNVSRLLTMALVVVSTLTTTVALLHHKDVNFILATQLMENVPSLIAPNVPQSIVHGVLGALGQLVLVVVLGIKKELDRRIKPHVMEDLLAQAHPVK
jgi:hypothetical protein